MANVYGHGIGKVAYKLQDGGPVVERTPKTNDIDALFRKYAPIGGLGLPGLSSYTGDMVSEIYPAVTRGMTAFGASMAPGAGVADYIGQLPDMQGGKYPSFPENIEGGRYLDAALQGLGVAGDTAYGLGPAAVPFGMVAKAPRAVKAALSAARAGDIGSGQHVYHATFTNRIGKIKEQGVSPLGGGTTNWEKAGGGRYQAEPAVYAFDSPEAALRWAKKMKYEFKEPVSIIKAKRSGQWADDPSADPSFHGKPIQSPDSIKPDDIVSVTNVEDLPLPGAVGMDFDSWATKYADEIGASGESPPLPMDTPARMKRAEEMGNTVDAYHGTARIDRLLASDSLDKGRATSGPMPFFSSDPSVASGYALTKADTSRLTEDAGGYENWFKYTNPSGNNEPFTAMWERLPQGKRAELRQAFEEIGQDWDTGEIVRRSDLDNVAGASKSHWDWTLKEHKGNALEAAKDIWLDSGNLYDQEEGFMKVLDLAGVEGVKFDSPYMRAPGVLPVKLRIENPFETTPDNVKELIPYLEDMAPTPQGLDRSHGVDMWDKNTMDSDLFIERLKDDVEEGTTFAWTSIPDWVTDALRQKGYDSIKDLGGKNMGVVSDVYIPFDANQARSRFAKFDPAKKDLPGLGMKDGGVVRAPGVYQQGIGKVAYKLQAGGTIPGDTLSSILDEQMANKFFGDSPVVERTPKTGDVDALLRRYVPPHLRESLGRIPEAALAVSDFVGVPADIKDMKHYSGATMDSLRDRNYSDALANTLMTGAALGMTALPGSVGWIDKTVKKLGVGDTVTHDKFGSGKILSTTENNLTVDFPGKGETLLNKNMVNEADLLSDVVTNPTANTFDTVESMVERLKEAGYEVIDENIRRSSNIAGRSAYLNVLKDRKRLPIRVSDHWSKWNEGLRVDAGDTPESILAKVDEHFAGPLPMDTASRMKRMEEMGFDTDAYHATDAVFSRFDLSKSGGSTARALLDDSAEAQQWANNLAEAGVWTSSKPLATRTGSNIDMPLKIRGKMETYGSLEEMEAVIREHGGPKKYRAAMEDKGYDGAKVLDEEFGGESYVVFNPKNLRSRFAKFDPAKKDLPGLSMRDGGVVRDPGVYEQGIGRLAYKLQDGGEVMGSAYGSTPEEISRAKPLSQVALSLSNIFDPRRRPILTPEEVIETPGLRETDNPRIFMDEEGNVVRAPRAFDPETGIRSYFIQDPETGVGTLREVVPPVYGEAEKSFSNTGIARALAGTGEYFGELLNPETRLEALKAAGNVAVGVGEGLQNQMDAIGVEGRDPRFSGIDVDGQITMANPELVAAEVAAGGYGLSKFIPNSTGEGRGVVLGSTVGKPPTKTTGLLSPLLAADKKKLLDIGLTEKQAEIVSGAIAKIKAGATKINKREQALLSRASAAGHQRSRNANVKLHPQIKGAPSHITGPEAHDALLARLAEAINAGAANRRWYPESTNALTESYLGDPEKTRRLLIGAGIASQQTRVGRDLGIAHRAMINEEYFPLGSGKTPPDLTYQDLLGASLTDPWKPGHMYGVVDDKLRRLAAGQPVEPRGGKIGPYTINLLTGGEEPPRWMRDENPWMEQHLDPSGKNQAVADTIMHSLYGYPGSPLASSTRNYITPTLREAAGDSTGPVSQYQAMAWEAQQGRMGGSGGYSLKDATDEMTGNMNVETVFGSNTGIERAWNTNGMSWETKNELDRRIRGAFTDQHGRSKILDMAGLPQVHPSRAIGSFEGQTNPVTSFSPVMPPATRGSYAAMSDGRVLIPRQIGGMEVGVPEFLMPLDDTTARAATMATLLHQKLGFQKAMGWIKPHVAGPDAPIDQSDFFLVDVGRTLSKGETEAIAKLMYPYGQASPIASGQGVSFLNFSDLPGPEFRSKVVAAADEVLGSETYGFIHAPTQRFYNDHDWKGGYDATKMDEAIAKLGPEFSARARDIQQEIAPRYGESIRLFGEEHGLTVPDELKRTIEGWTVGNGRRTSVSVGQTFPPQLATPPSRMDMPLGGGRYSKPYGIK